MIAVKIKTILLKRQHSVVDCNRFHSLSQKGRMAGKSGVSTERALCVPGASELSRKRNGFSRNLGPVAKCSHLETKCFFQMLLLNHELYAQNCNAEPQA